jgi:hypothetical protein
VLTASTVKTQPCPYTREKRYLNPKIAFVQVNRPTCAIGQEFLSAKVSNIVYLPSDMATHGKNISCIPTTIRAIST